MTIHEYEDKKSKLQSSEAHPSVKEEALLKLEEKFRGNYLARNKAMEQFLESQADLDDLKGGM